MKCLFIKPNGDRCGANAMSDSDYCYLHNPEISQEDKLVAQTRGGQNRSPKVYQPLPPIKIKKTSDIMGLLNDTINQVRQGKLDCRVGNTIGYLAGVAIKAFETSELEERLEQIELVIKNKDE